MNDENGLPGRLVEMMGVNPVPGMHTAPACGEIAGEMMLIPVEHALETFDPPTIAVHRHGGRETFIQQESGILALSTLVRVLKRQMTPC